MPTEAPSPPQTESMFRVLLRALLQATGAAAVLWLLVYVAGLILFGSLDATLAYLQGQSLFVASPHQDIGTIPPDKESPIRFSLRNITFGPITIQGAETSCGCVANGEDMPILLRAGETKEVVFTITPTKMMANRAFTHEAKLFVDPPGPQITLSFAGSVSGPAP